MKKVILFGIFFMNLGGPDLLFARSFSGGEDINNMYRAYSLVERDQLKFANSLAGTLTRTDGVGCYRQDTYLEATQLATNALSNLLMHLKMLKEIPRDATHESLLAEYPHLERLLSSSLEYKIRRAEYHDPQLPTDVLEKTLPGVIVYNQKLPAREEKQNSYEFLAGGRVKYTDAKGNIAEGNWSIERASLYMVRAAVRIKIGETEKLFALSPVSTTEAESYFKPYSQMALAEYTTAADNPRMPVWNKNQIYMSLKYNCLAYAN